MYTLQIMRGGYDKATQLSRSLQERIIKDGRFRINDVEFLSTPTNREDRRQLGKVYSLPSLVIRGVRLAQMKPYCGNHPGECVVNPFTGREPRKPNSTHLEWDDWVAFHALVNGVLSQRHTHANVWTVPRDRLDQGRRMWIRRGLLPRVRWDYQEDWSMGLRIQVWNHGTPDQFQR